MTNISSEAVERLAKGLEDHAARTNMGFRKSYEADALRAQAERIKELEHFLRQEQKSADKADGIWDDNYAALERKYKTARNDALREAAGKVSACTWGDYWNHNGMLVAPADLASIILDLIEGDTND